MKNNVIDNLSLILQVLSLEVLFKDFNNTDLMQELQNQDNNYLQKIKNYTLFTVFTLNVSSYMSLKYSYALFKSSSFSKSPKTVGPLPDIIEKVAL